MREGLTVLWAAAVGISAFSWFYQKLSGSSLKRIRSRCRITGCELARQVLDHARLNRVAVTSARGPARGHLGFSLDRLRLPWKVYYGDRLSDMAQAIHEAAHQIEAQHVLVPWGLRAPGGGIFQAVIIVSWALVLGGSFGPDWQGTESIGRGLFLTGFLMALGSLPGEWEVTDRALSSLGALEGLAPDEKIRLKKALRVLRWLPLVETLEAPWNAIVKGVLLGLSKSE